MAENPIERLISPRLIRNRGNILFVDIDVGSPVSATIAGICGQVMIPPVPAMPYPTIKSIIPQITDIAAALSYMLSARRGTSGMTGSAEAALDLYMGQEQTVERLARMPNSVLRGVLARLTGIIRKSEALDLVAAHFPDRLGQYPPQAGWDDILFDFINCVGLAGWLPLDAETIRWASDQVRFNDDDREFAELLRFIPIEAPGYDYEDVWESSLGYSPTGLLYGLFVDPGVFIGMADRAGWGIGHFDWIDADGIAQAVYQAPPGTFKLGTPLVYLPEAVAIYRQETGFALVDDADTSRRTAFGGLRCFEWADLDLLKKEWTGGALRPLLDHCEALESWLWGQENVRQLVSLLHGLSEGCRP